MAPVAQMDEVKKQHQELYRELQGELRGVAKPFGGKKTVRHDKFLARVNSLLKSLKSINDGTELTVAEYDWLSSTVSEWQFALSSILGVSADIPILQPPSSIATPLVSEPEIRDYFQRRAHEMSQARKYQILVRRLGEELHRIQSSSEAEVLDDWHHAELCFGSDILNGDGELWNQIGGDVTQENQRWRFLSSAVFGQLQQIWLSDVLRFHAYVKWVHQGADASSDTRSHYEEARREFAQRVENGSIKFDGKGAYDVILDYLTSTGLTSSGYRFDPEKSGARKCVEAKAYRIYDVTGSRDELANWNRAESYVVKFYNSVVSAIVDDDAVSKAELGEALSLSEDPKYGCSITDCFEAMVLVYCVRNFTLPDVWTAPLQ